MFNPNKIRITAILISVLVLANTSHAGDDPIEISQRISNGDPVAGKEKSTLCQGCHGENGIV